MTVSDLIKNLQKMPPQLEVAVWYGSGVRGETLEVLHVDAKAADCFEKDEEIVIIDSDGEARKRLNELYTVLN